MAEMTNARLRDIRKMMARCGEVEKMRHVGPQTIIDLLATVGELAGALKQSNERLEDFIAVQQTRETRGEGRFGSFIAMLRKTIAVNNGLLDRLGLEKSDDAR